MNNYIGNGSTVIKIVSMAFAGQCLGILASQGLDLGITESQLTELIGFIIGLIMAYIDAKYPNTFAFLGNAPDPIVIDSEEKVLNDEYEIGDDSDGC